MTLNPHARSGEVRAAQVRTFLIADVRGYTRFTREHGDVEAARLAKRFADLARDAVVARSGRVIELRGDEASAEPAWPGGRSRSWRGHGSRSGCATEVPNLHKAGQFGWWALQDSNL
jgi:class 3 adenylate cyclase